MDKVNSFLNKFLGFVDKNSTIVIILCAGIFIYKQFGALFTAVKDNKEERQKEQQAHNDNLLGIGVKPLPADKKQRAVVARQNVQILSARFDATVAEEIRKYTTFFAGGNIWMLMGERRTKLLALAAQISKYKGNLPNIASEYKKLCGKDMYEDVRDVMSDKYTSWIAAASKK